MIAAAQRRHPILKLSRHSATPDGPLQKKAAAIKLRCCGSGRGSLLGYVAGLRDEFGNDVL